MKHNKFSWLMAGCRETRGGPCGTFQSRPWGERVRSLGKGRWEAAPGREGGLLTQVGCRSSFSSHGTSVPVPDPGPPWLLIFSPWITRHTGRALLDDPGPQGGLPEPQANFLRRPEEVPLGPVPPSG